MTSAYGARQHASASTRHICLQYIHRRVDCYCGGVEKLHNLKNILTHWGRVTHICVSKLTIIGSDNGLSPGRRQAIIWTNAGILLIRTLGTNFSEILSKIRAFSLKKMHLKMSSAKWRPFCLGLNVLTINQKLFYLTVLAVLLSSRCHYTYFMINIYNGIEADFW